MKIVDEAFIEELIAEAEASPRRRAHRNLHPTLDDPVQRLCMAAFPGSYCRPHRHTGQGRWEMFIALRGAAAVLTFDDEGRVTGRHPIRGEGPARIVEVPPSAWHTVVVLEEKTVLFEVKPGPYVSSSDKEFASWAPAEESGEAGPCELKLRTCEVGETIPRG
jgi:cupin fold WbuC family metalloprotein